MRASARARAFVALLITGVGCRAAVPPSPSLDPVGIAARACARIASCSHAHDPVREREPSACVDWWFSRASESTTPADVRRCLEGATTCEAIDGCMGAAGDARAETFCRAHPGVQTACEGNDRFACGADDPTESTRTDCATLGAVCGETHGAGGLDSHACVDPARCPADLTRARCDGEGAVITCHDGALERTACAAGDKCRSHAHGDGAEFAECVGGGEAECTAVGAVGCEGSRVIECEPRGHTGRRRITDCGALGLVCRTSPGKAHCAARDATCASGPPRCDGEAIEFCAAGRAQRVSCASLGMGPCDPDARGMEAGCKVANSPAIR